MKVKRYIYSVLVLGVTLCTFKLSACIYWLCKACILIEGISGVCYHCNFQAGLIEEMMEDTFESLEDDDLEEQADQEVEKILWEVTSGKENTIVIIIAENFQ